MADGAKKQVGYKKLNGFGRGEVAIICFMLLFQCVVCEQVFLYLRKKRVFWEGLKMLLGS